MAEVPVFVRIRGAKDGSVNAVIGQVKGEVRRLTADVVDTGSKIGLAFGGGAAGIIAMGVAALKTAGQFEQLEAKLRALLKDGEAAQQNLVNAAALATLTPFSVEGLVNATVQLTAYGQRARAILPQVADLAAAMGKSVEEASLAVGKAASGSAEGFQSLRDTFGLTTAELKKMGVELNDSGGPLLRTPEQIEKARQALLRLIEVKFGGSAAAQSQTFEGAMSNVGDAAQLALNKVGKSLLPIATLLARFSADFIGRFQNLPGPVVAAGVALGGLTAAALAFVSTATLAGTAILSWYTGLQAAAATSGAARAALSFIASSFVDISLRAEAAQAKVASFGTSMRFLGASLGIATAAFVVGTVAIRAYEQAQEKAGKAVEEASKKSVSATNRWKLYHEAINEAAAGTGVLVDRGGSLQQTAEQVAEAFKKATPADLVASFERAGFTLEDVRRQSGQVQDELTAAQQKYQKLQDAVGKSEARGKNAIPVTQGLQQLFPGKISVSIGEAQQKAAQLKFEMLELGRTKVAVEGALGAFEKFAAPLQAAIDGSKKLDSFLSFTKSSKDLQTLQSRLQVTTQELRQFEAAARKQGLPTEAAALQQELLTATGTRKAFAEQFLTTIAQQADAERDLANQTAAAEQIKLDAVEKTQERRRALNDVSKAQELQFARERLAVVEGNLAKEANLEKQLAEVRALKTKQPTLAGVDGRIRQLEAELEGVRKLADEEVTARAGVRTAAKALDAEKAANAKKSIQDQVDAAKSLVATLKTDEGANAGAISGQLRQILAGLDQWEAKNKTLVSSSREVRRSLEQAREAIEGQQAAIREKVQAARLEEVKQKVSIELADAPDTITKLNTVRGAIAQINAERKSGLIDAKAGQAALVDLQRQELALNKQNNAEIADKAATLASITQGSLEKEVEHLKARGEAGEDVTKKLAAKEKELLAAKVAAIEAAYQADIAANKDREVAAAERNAKLRALLLDETNAKIQANKAANDAIDADNRSRDGGSSSGPGVPGEAYTTGIKTSGFSTGRQIRRQVKVPTPEQVGRQIGIGGGAQERFDKLTKAGFKVAAPTTKDEAKATTQQVNDNRSFTAQIMMEGVTVADVAASPALRSAVLAIVEKRFRDEGYRDGGEGAWP